jgi:hypothetical protein
VTTFADIVGAGKATTDQAWSLFDDLDAVEPDFMTGAWRGSGFPTGHPMDGLLEAYRWHGKHFDGTGDVHPLVFETAGGQTHSINPLFLLPILGMLDRCALPRTGLLPWVFSVLMPMFSTRRTRARLRLTRYRGRDTATMIYDHLPIHDIFRKVDDNTVLGVMDLKGMRQPYFFVLRRE